MIFVVIHQPSSDIFKMFDQMVILPCSAGTMNKIACGFADSLMTRAAMVTLKEGYTIELI